MKRPRMDVNLEELDQIIERGTHAPLSESESEKLKSALHALAGMLPQPRSTEKTKYVLEQSAASAPENEPEPAKGHGRNGASSYIGAQKVGVPHPQLHAGDPCPGCEKGKVYPQKEPRTLVRVVGQAPLAATVYELDRLRCNLCGEVFTAPEPEGIGPEKYDETTAAMIALLKYGSGMPFYRLEKLEQALGIPLPASTQWEIVEDEAELIQAARDELIRQAAQGEVLHNDDTGMRVLRMAREPSDGRTGVFTSGIVSTQQGRRIALYFTGRQHAGENLRDVLRHRSADLGPPLQMCDALSRNTPKLSDGAEILLANCLAHGRRQFVDVAANFPEPCRYVLETLGDVYKYDAEARERHLSAVERLQFHRQHSGPVMEQLHQWLEAQFALKQVEPNSGLGKAITYLLRHWKALTAFLREAGAPLDNNVCERALKRAGLHRKNALFYRTLHGAEAGSVHEPDPHLRTRRCQSVRLPHPVTAACQRTGGQPVGVDALELSGTNSTRPYSLVCGQPCFSRCHTPEMPRKQAFPKAPSNRVFGHPLRVGLYAPVSTQDQQTLPLQIRAMREYAAKRNWIITVQIKEVGSGASERERRQQLIAAARRREIDVVLVWRLDRWGRSVADLVGTLQELQHLGVGFVSLTEALDLTTPTGRAMAGLLAVFAEFEREILRERVRAGLAHARQQGKHLGRPPSVLDKSIETHKLYRQGSSKSEIARRLQISRTSVRRLLNQKKS